MAVEMMPPALGRSHDGAQAKIGRRTGAAVTSSPYRGLILVLIACALLEGVLSAVRWPQNYAMTHLVINYHFGFGKRGLMGAVMRVIDRPPYRYLTLAEIAFAVFAASIGLLLAAAWRNLRRDAGFGAAFILFFLSVGFSSLVCDVGRGEHFGFLLATICLLLPVTWPWLILRAALLTTAVLIQEVNFLIFVPLTAVDVLAGVAGRAVRGVLASVATVVPATLATWWLGNSKTACDTSAAVAYFQHLTRDFPISPIPVITLCLDGSHNFSAAIHELWSVGRWAVLPPLVLLACLPSTIFNLWLALRLSRGNRALPVLGVLAALSPLLLLGVAVDIVRFVTLIQLTSLMLLVSAGRRFGLPEQGALPPMLKHGAVLTGLAAIQLGSAVTLNDGHPMLKFPFQPLVVRVEEIITGHQKFFVIPPD